MFFILVLVVAVAVFNLVSSLVMAVNQKRAEIAIMQLRGFTAEAEAQNNTAKTDTYTLHQKYFCHLAP